MEEFLIEELTVP